MATAARSPIENVSYADLYERWENGHWKATELDFSQDRSDWREKFSDIERKGALWNYAMFFHGEDSVADNLSPYIDAAPREEQKYFLTTQQVDEARHAVFFARFMREVVETGASDVAGSLQATRPELTWGFRKTFERLDRMADELRADRSKPKLAAAITLYHLIVEATLAQPGQHFIEDYLGDRGVLPGFYEGMRNVSRDEQRHIGFGVKILSDLVAEDPECKDAIADLLREMMPMTIGVFVPPGWDTRYVECFGKTIEDVYEDGMVSLESKLRAAGLPLEELPGAPPIPLEIPPRERAERAIRLVRAGILGEANGAPSKEPEVMELMFDSIRQTMDVDSAPRGLTIQWDFADAPPWFLRVDNGTSETQQGRLESADITFQCRYDDWVDIVASREDPRRAILRRKIRPRGNPLTLWRTRGLFGR